MVTDYLTIITGMINEEISLEEDDTTEEVDDEKEDKHFYEEQLVLFGTGGNKFEKTRCSKKNKFGCAMDLVLNLFSSLWWGLY